MIKNILSQKSKQCFTGKARRRLINIATCGLILGFTVAVNSSSAMEEDRNDQRPTIVVTTTMLEAAVRDALGHSDKLRIIRLLPPGGCPGHFDLSPRALPLLRQARYIIRHDFQAALDRKIAHLGADDLESIAVKGHGSLLIPENYQRLVKTITKMLINHGLLPAPPPDTEIELPAEFLEKMLELETLAESHRREFSGRPVIASLQQKAFCEWLGYEVKGELARPENTTPGNLRELVGTEASIVIANLQSDSGTGRTVAGRKGKSLAIISNFPNAAGYGQGYFELFKANLRQLEAARDE